MHIREGWVIIRAIEANDTTAGERTMYFLALDLGTSFLKGALLDLGATALHHPQRQPFPDPVPDLPPHFFEAAPNAVVDAARQLIDDLLEAAGDGGEACAGLLACSQMHGFLLTEPDGTPLSNVITWRDERAVTQRPSGGTYFDGLMARLNPDDVQALGNGLRPGLPAGALFWLAQNNHLPANATPASLPDWVLQQLCAQSGSGAGISQAVPVIEPTNAAAYGLLDLAKRDWHRGVIEKLGLAHLRWPTVQPVHQATGTPLELHGRQVPVYPTLGDHQTALLGTGLQAGELSLNVATGSQVSLVVPRHQPGNYEVRPYFGGHYLNTIANIPAGRALGTLVDLLSELARAEGVDLRDPWGSIARAAEAVPKTDVAVDLSFFAANLATGSAGHTGGAGSMTNLREDNLTAGHLFRAAFERMAEDFYAQAQRFVPGQKSSASLEPGAAPWSQIAFSGGLAQRMGVLRELIAARFGCGYRLSSGREDALLGLLALALSLTDRADSTSAAAALLREQAGGPTVN